MPLNDNTLNQLEQKHPQGKKADVDVLLTDKPEKFTPSNMNALTQTW